MNLTILSGNLGRDPESKATTSGKTVANFTLATQSFGREKKTEWHNVVAFDKTADLAVQYLKKGSQVLVVGRTETRSWDDKSSGEKKYRTEVIADRIEFLGGRKDEFDQRAETADPLDDVAF